LNNDVIYKGREWVTKCQLTLAVLDSEPLNRMLLLLQLSDAFTVKQTEIKAAKIFYLSHGIKHKNV